MMLNQPDATVYLTRDDIIEMNKRYSNGGILNEGNLVGAVDNPSLTFGGEQANPTFGDKCFAYAQGIALGHPFQDGNKRTATDAIYDFLVKNGITGSSDNTKSIICKVVNSIVLTPEELEAEEAVDKAKNNFKKRLYEALPALRGRDGVETD